MRAVIDPRPLCSEYCNDRHEIELVDIVLEPDKVFPDHRLLAPPMVRTSPRPLLGELISLTEREPTLVASGVNP